MNEAQFIHCRFGSRVSTCYHNPRCHNVPGYGFGHWRALVPPEPLMVVFVCQCQAEAAHESWPELTVWTCAVRSGEPRSCTCPCHKPSQDEIKRLRLHEAVHGKSCRCAWIRAREQFGWTVPRDPPAEPPAESVCPGPCASHDLYMPHPEPAHLAQGHEPGTLWDCPGCEARCHCDPSMSPCVYDGPHDARPLLPDGTRQGAPRLAREVSQGRTEGMIYGRAGREAPDRVACDQPYHGNNHMRWRQR